MFVCPSWIFHSFGKVIIAGEGLEIFTYAWQLWPLSSEGSLACHTYCDTGQPFIMVISEDPGHSRLCRALSSGSVTNCSKDLCQWWLGFEHQTFRLRSGRSKPLCYRRSCNISNVFFQESIINSYIVSLFQGDSLLPLPLEILTLFQSLRV